MGYIVIMKNEMTAEYYMDNFAADYKAGYDSTFCGGDDNEESLARYQRIIAITGNFKNSERDAAYSLLSEADAAFLMGCEDGEFES